MARRESYGALQRRRTWDPTQISTKYPWLRVDSETIEEFQSPFEWVQPPVDEIRSHFSSSDDGGSGSSSKSLDNETKAEKPHQRRRRRRNVAASTTTTAHPHGQNNVSINTKPTRKRKLPQTKQQRIKAHEAAVLRHENFQTVSPLTTRSEAEETPKTTVTTAPTAVVVPAVFPASVYSDFQTLKQQRQRHAHHHHHKTSKPHYDLRSLSLPTLHKPKPAAALKNAVPLSQQLEILTRQEHNLQQRVLEQIEQEKAKLPLTFLFERNLDKTYCKQKCVATITSIFAKLQHRMMFYAFQKWLAWRNALVDQERRDKAVQQAQKKALAFFERIASDAYVGTIGRAFTKWHTTAKQLAASEMRAAAIKIQALYRRRRAKTLLRDLKQASLDREYKRSVEIQRLLKFESYGTAMKWSTLRNGFNLVLQSHCAKRIQYFFRRIRTRKRIARRVRRTFAATKIQSQWRARCARLERKRLERAKIIRLQREHVASIHMQRRARGYLARQHVALRRLQLSTENVSAEKIQRAWRKHQEWQTLLCRFQLRRGLLDDARAREEEQARIEEARRNELRRNERAVEIQRMARGFVGRRQAKRRRYARDLDRAVRRVQLSWRKSKGRYALHLRFLAQRERLDDRRDGAALTLQCWFRVIEAKRGRDFLLTEKQHRRISAMTIQRFVRGRQARLAYAKVRRSTVSIQTVWRGKLARQERSKRRQQRDFDDRQRLLATLKLQRVARGHQGRRRTQQLRDEQQRLQKMIQQSAVLIQKRARGMEARKTSILLKKAMQVIDRQQKRAYQNSTQLHVNETPLLTFLTTQYFTKGAATSGQDQGEDDGVVRYTRDQLQWIQAQIDATTAQMEKEDRAILTLQHHYRGYATRAAFIVKLAQQKQRLVVENKMARKIQKTIRGFLARRRVHKLRSKKRGEEIKEAYIRERKWKEQERVWQDQYKQEQMALQLQRLQTLEANMKDAKRDAEIAKWQAEAAAFRKQELQAQVEAKKLERALRKGERGRRGGESSDDDEEDEEDEEELKASRSTTTPWEYVVDGYGNWYYYNTATGESSWEKPEVIPVQAVEPVASKSPKKKKTKATTTVKAEKKATVPETKEQPAAEAVDTVSESVVAASTTATTTTTTTTTPDGFCGKCKCVVADKECLDCRAPSPSLYCGPCFTLEHGLLTATTSKATHDFKVLRALVRPSKCQQGTCSGSASSPSPALAPAPASMATAPPPSQVQASPASFYCGECPPAKRFSCESCFPFAHDSALTTHHIPKSIHFRSGALLCVECESLLATRQCPQCEEAFCSGCYDLLHTNTKSSHEFTVPEIIKDDLASERDAYCGDCEIKKAARLCNLCGDGFCEPCFTKAHSKGQKISHTFLPWDQFATHGDWLEIQDPQNGKLVYFNIETKESTHTQPFVMKSGQERHRVMFQEREAGMRSKNLELESEIIKLKEQLQLVESDKLKEQTLRRRASEKRQQAMVEKELAEARKKQEKKGLLRGLFKSKKGTDKQVDAMKKTLTPEEYKRLALQQSIAQTPGELAMVRGKLMTREREQKEEKAKNTVGTIHFERAMVDQLAAQQPPSTG